MGKDDFKHHNMRRVVCSLCMLRNNRELQLGRNGGDLRVARGAGKGDTVGGEPLLGGERVRCLYRWAAEEGTGGAGVVVSCRC